MRIGQILVKIGSLKQEQLKAVLDERDLLGGRLGTQLVERGLVDTEQVSEALSRQLRVPAALQRHFDRADPAIVALLKPNLAARYMAVPLVAARSGIKRILVALATPQEELVVEEVSFALGVRVEPMVAAELAIARNLKRYYNIDVKLARPPRPETTRGTGSVSSRELPALADEPLYPSRPTLPLFADGEAGEPPAGEPPRALPPSLDAAVALEDVIRRLGVAEEREQVADILVDFMMPHFGCGLVFLLRGGNAHVWRGFSPGVEARALETINFPLAMPSVFRTTQERGETFRGPLPTDAGHLHVQIWKYLGCETPTEAIVVPVTIGERVVCLVYAHAKSKLSDASVKELEAACGAAGRAFVRLIQAAKEGQEHTTLLPR